MTRRSTTSLSDPDVLEVRARMLGLCGLVAHFDDYKQEPWLPLLLGLEETERKRRSLERRLKAAKLGRFKSIVDFDWSWPKSIDRALITELFELRFLDEAMNVVFIGQNGVGKTMLAENLAHQAVLKGKTALLVSASDLLNDLASQDSARSLQARLRAYAKPDLLLIDEVGYLSSSAKHADLLFEVVNRRYQQRSIVLTTNKPFTEWNQVFPNAGCIVTLIDRLVHKAEIVQIDGESFRLKEAKERAANRKKRR